MIPQAKLLANQPDDPYEQEASSVADSVMSMTDLEAARPLSPNSEGPKETASQPPTTAQALMPGDLPPALKEGLRSAGSSLDADLRTFMEPRFGHDFRHVRVHTDERAAGSVRSMNALAYTLGQHIVFDNGQYAPATSTGRWLLAHELTHVIQQEQGQQALAQPSLHAELRVQRWGWGFAQAPDNLQTMSAEEKANWIKEAMKEDRSGTSAEIVKVFKSATSPGAFLDIQKFLDMDAVINYLDAWNAAQVGALGPVLAGVEKLNQKRADSIVQTSHDFGLARGQTFTYFIFNSMYTNDMDAVLKILAHNRRLKHTIEEMDAIKELITQRGLKLSDYQDEKAPVKDVFRAIGQWVEDFLSSSELGKFAKSTNYYALKESLPGEYRKVLDTIESKELEQALSPKNVALGMADYIALGIPSSIYGLVAGTVRGVKDIAQGDVEKGTYELTGAAILVLSFLGVKAYRAIRGKEVALAPGEVMGPTGPGQFVIKGYTGPITPEEARLGALLQLNPEAQGAAGLLLGRLGKQGVLDVGRYVQANSKAAVFVYERGLPAAEALQKAGGDLAKAEALLSAEAGQGTAPKLLTAGAQGAEAVEFQKGTLKVLKSEGSPYSPEEMASAQFMAEKVFNNPSDSVVLRPPKGARAPTGATSDLTINGKTYDIYSPKAADRDVIFRGVYDKNSQATGIVLDLSKSPIKANQLGNLMGRLIGKAKKDGLTLNITDIYIIDDTSGSNFVHLQYNPTLAE